MTKPQKKAATQNYVIGLPYLEAHRFANACAHCMGKEETRYYLRGVWLGYDAKKRLMAVSTDGHRLAHCTVNYEAANGNLDGDLNCILPDAAIEWLLKLPKSDNFVMFTINQSTLAVTIAYGELTANFKLVDGQYPDWQRIWDKAASECNREPTAFFSVEYLNDIAKSVKKSGKGKHRIGLVFSRENPDNAPLIVETSDTGVHYLLMPMR